MKKIMSLFLAAALTVVPAASVEASDEAQGTRHTETVVDLMDGVVNLTDGMEEEVSKETDAVNLNERETTVNTIISFAELPEWERFQYVIDREMPAESALAASMPNRLEAYTDESEEPVWISVEWDCEDAVYADSANRIVAFVPVWDESEYVLSDTAALPVILAGFRCRGYDPGEAVFNENADNSGESTQIFGEDGMISGQEGIIAGDDEQDKDETLLGSVTGIANEEVCYRFMTQTKGLGCASASAILGNLYIECSFNPLAHNVGENAWGICQWRFDRLEKLQSRYPNSWKTLDSQLRYMFDEFGNASLDYAGPSTYAYIKGIADTNDGVRAGAKYFAQYFERCDSSTYSSRQDWAVRFHNAYHNGVLPKPALETPDMTISNSASGVLLKWNKVTEAGGYRLFRRKSTESRWTVISAGSAATAFLDAEAEPGVCYVYTVRAYRGKISEAEAAGYSSEYWSGFRDNAYVTIYTAAPSISIDKTTDSSIRINWAKVKGAGGYVIQKLENGNWTDLVRTSNTEYTISGLKKGASVTLRAQSYAKDSSGKAYYSVIGNQVTGKAVAVTYADMYRLYNPNSGEHFYTASAAERNHLATVGWKYEGIAWQAPSSGDAVYRLYNPNAGDHHYTVSAAERDSLRRLGWNYEGICWYSGGKTAMLRLYNPNATTGSHHYTANADEKNWLVKNGWVFEGTGWYGK